MSTDNRLWLLSNFSPLPSIRLHLFHYNLTDSLQALVCIALSISCMYEPKDGSRRKHDVSEVNLPGCMPARGIGRLDLMLTVVCACAVYQLSMSIATRDSSNSSRRFVIRSK